VISNISQCRGSASEGHDEHVPGRLAQADVLALADQPLLDDPAALDDPDAEMRGR
jgi:hypothetical protein